MYKFYVAFRYLRRNWLNVVGIAAVALSVLVLICVLSVMKGFDEELRGRIRATLTDLIVENWTDDAFEDYEDVMAKIERIPHVVAVAPHYEGLALVRLNPDAKTPQQRVGQFIGVDLERELKTTDFLDYWQAWRGREAKDAITEVVEEYGDVDNVPRETLTKYLNQMRSTDFEFLDRKNRKAIRSWADRTQFDLNAAFNQAKAARPTWGEVENPEKYSPAFGGTELLTLGRTQGGKFVTVPVGDNVVVVSASGIFDRNLRRAQIVGKYRSGLYEYDQRNVYLPLQDVQKYMGKPGRVTSVNVRLDSFDNAPQVRCALLGVLSADELGQAFSVIKRLTPKDAPDYDQLPKIELAIKELREKQPNWFAAGDRRAYEWSNRIEEVLIMRSTPILRTAADGKGIAKADLHQLQSFQQLVMARKSGGIGKNFRVMTWEDQRRSFLRAVWLERQIMGFILFFAILIAGFLILAIIHTTVLSKMKDIGILKSIGGSVGGIMSVFLINGLLMGVIGATLGTVGGVLFTRNINLIQEGLEKTLGFSVFPQDIYYLDRIPIDKDPTFSIAVICITAILVSLAASAYPAWKASRLDAVEALRYE